MEATNQNDGVVHPWGSVPFNVHIEKKCQTRTLMDQGGMIGSKSSTLLIVIVPPRLPS